MEEVKKKNFNLRNKLRLSEYAYLSQTSFVKFVIRLPRKINSYPEVLNFGSDSYVHVKLMELIIQFQKYKELCGKRM